MIYEILDLISAMALVVIAVQITLMVCQTRWQARFEVIQRTYEEIHRNTHQRRLLVKVSSLSQGKEFDENNWLDEDE